MPVRRAFTAIRLICLLWLALVADIAFAQHHRPLQVNNRVTTSINDKWQFAIDSGNHSYEGLNALHNWQTVSLPHTWNASDVFDDEHVYYRGAGWYKKKLIIGTADKSRQVFLYFDGVNQQAEVYINGHKAGEHSGGYTRFCIPVTPWLKRSAGDSINEIAIKVDNRYNENIPPLTADFTFFGGIYRNVYLVTTSPVHFNMADYASSSVQITTPIVTAQQARVIVKTQLANSSGKTHRVNLITTLYSRDGAVVSTNTITAKLQPGKTDTLVQKIAPVNQPHLWSPESPYLYRVVTRIQDKSTGEITDEVSNPLGLRWYSFNADKGFFLNGKPCKLIGASRHQDYKNLGNAVPDALQMHDMELLKQMGGNYVRISHYPQDPAILEMCDKLGIIASMEIPVVNGITESEVFRNNCSTMLREMIRQNFNHPSVVIWAYMNEVLLRPRYGNDKPRQQQYFSHVAELARNLEEICHTEDSSRYTMIANHGDFNLYNRIGLTTIPRIVGWNLYQGWYGNDIGGFARFLDQHHQQLPQKPMLVTEYGADADDRIHSLQPVRFDKSIEYAAYYHSVYLTEIQKRSFVAGAAAWNLADFSSESREETMPHINNKGLLTLDRKPKETYYLYQAALLKTPFIKIASASMRAGVANATGTTCTQAITVYSNLDDIQLFVNGKPVQPGVKQPYGYTFQVSFMDGKNIIDAIAGIGTRMHKDHAEVEFSIQQPDLKHHLQNFSSLNIVLGAKRSFYDEVTQQLWQPDQPYQKGGWGYIGGVPFKMSNGRQSYGSDKAIAGTDNDPVYQTQQVGIQQYRLDVPDGQYELCLNFAELAGGKAKDPLPYNLNDSTSNPAYYGRIFDVYVNDQLMLKDFNIAAEYGFAWAVCKKMPVTVTCGQGICISFKARKGEPVLNALQLRRIY